MRARLLLAAAVASLAFSPPAWGQAPSGSAQRRLLVIEPLPKGAAERIAGQIADLPWAMEHTKKAARLAEIDAQAAGALAAERGARAVVWVEEDSGGFVLHLFDADKHELVDRQLPRAQAASPLARSAALEALALAVRSGLSALSAEPAASGTAASASATTPDTSTRAPDGNTPAHAGTSEATATSNERAQAAGAQHAALHEQRAEPKTQEPKRATTESAQPEPEPTRTDAAQQDEEPDQPASHQAEAALIIAGGWSAALDGQSPIQHGPWARFGVELDRLELALEGQFALPAEIRDRGGTRIDVQRSTALASASLAIVHAKRAQLAIAAGAGIASFARDTRQVAPGLQATGASDVQTFAAELELRGRLRLVSTSALALDLELGLGALALPASPTLRYEGATGRIEHALWSLQPQLHIGPCLRISL